MHLIRVGVKRFLPRYVFMQFYNELVSKADKKKWDDLSALSGEDGRGKQAKKDEIIMKYVPMTDDYKAKFKPDVIKCAKQSKKEFTNRDQQQEEGMSRSLMLYTIFHGNKANMLACENDGGILEGADGQMYTKKTLKVKRWDDSESVKGTITFLPSTIADMSLVMCEMVQALPDVEQTKNFTRANGSLALCGLTSNKPPTDIDMLMLQDSFDSITKVTTSIKQVARVIFSSGKATATSDIAKRGFELCKQIVPASEDMEKMMFMERQNLERGSVCDAVANAEAPYLELLKYYNELVNIVKAATPKEDNKHLPKFLKITDRM